MAKKQRMRYNTQHLSITLNPVHPDEQIKLVLLSTKNMLNE